MAEDYWIDQNRAWPIDGESLDCRGGFRLPRRSMIARHEKSDEHRPFQLCEAFFGRHLDRAFLGFQIWAKIDEGRGRFSSPSISQ